ncbi:MAG TPA: aminomethyl-transferring glycine dehydrogenase [Mycobacteriales bacterium]|nr:aminomethyl-transferring glycine dehydrogenase [Mycobacteriales bacterium]
MSDHVTLSELESSAPFASRHIGTNADEQERMLAAVGYGSVEQLCAAAVPSSIADTAPLQLPAAADEAAVLAELRELAGRNRTLVSMIGLGYSDTITPPVIRRNVMEDPSWYTAYTPYQPEISQGRLEALLTFQTMVSELAGLQAANASLLDEATAAAEAVALARRASTAPAGAPVVVDADCLPQTIAVVRTRARPMGIPVVVRDVAADGLPDGELVGLLLQYPGASGAVRDLAGVVAEAKARGAVVAVGADLLALTLLKPPGEWGADVVVGSTQRFGVPLGFGGPHAGFMAVRAGLERQLPGRLVGVSRDADGRPAYRLALQTREQHIRREKATSNICTAQVLLAVMAGAYAVYHGPKGLRGIARRVHRYTATLAAGLAAGGVEVVHRGYFDTVLTRVPGRADDVVAAAVGLGVNLRRVDADHVGVACDEVTRRDHLTAVWSAFGVEGSDVDGMDVSTPDALPAGLVRRSEFLTHPVFSAHHSETAMLRYLRRLSDKDYALDRGMIPLGSCTMKLNATAEMEPVSLPGFAAVHPFAPAEQVPGYLELIGDLERWLAEITGYDAVSLQPNAGSQGEFAGLLAIHAYHESRGQGHRDVCLIPQSAHGTNAASAAMAGMRVVEVRTRDDGDVDLDDLRSKLDAHRDRLAALMVTYPSTHGVFEEGIGEVCAAVHDAGGQVYVDGANLNALVGLAKPGRFGADVSHLNLHKTFCIPHGGGGPGVGPVAVRAHLAPHLPNHPLQPLAGPATGPGPVAAAPWGSASILPISWAYVRLMGPDGLAQATGAAILAANYVAARLREHYAVLYTGRGGLVAHECIVDLRPITRQTGVTVEDVAKRLIDYGFHAPTMSFPVAGTLMIEPTESEDLAELDRFVEAMIAIRGEIEGVASGEWDRTDNPLRNAPHTAAAVGRDSWERPYGRELAAYPGRTGREGKYWPPVRRIDGAYGDRNLVCACPPVSAYED